MKLLRQGNNVFVQIGEDGALCIGTTEEVNAAAGQKKLSDLINLAVAINLYQTKDWRFATKH